MTRWLVEVDGRASHVRPLLDLRLLLELQELIQQHLEFGELDEDVLLVSQNHLSLPVNVDLPGGYSAAVDDFVEFRVDRPEHRFLPQDLLDSVDVGLPEHQHLLEDGLPDLPLVDQSLANVVLEDVDLLEECLDDLEVVLVLGEEDSAMSLVAELNDPDDVLFENRDGLRLTVKDLDVLLDGWRSNAERRWRA